MQGESSRLVDGARGVTRNSRVAKTEKAARASRILLKYLLS